jgi:hypothetical protein
MAEEKDVIGEINLLRSKFASLEGLRESSMFMHNRLVPAFFQFAKEVMRSAIDLRDRYPGNKEVERWVNKLWDYAAQHGVNWNG